MGKCPNLCSLGIFSKNYDAQNSVISCVDSTNEFEKIPYKRSFPASSKSTIETLKKDVK